MRRRLTPAQKRSQARLDAWNAEAKRRLPPVDFDLLHEHVKVEMALFDQLPPGHREAIRNNDGRLL